MKIRKKITNNQTAADETVRDMRVDNGYDENTDKEEELVED